MLLCYVLPMPSMLYMPSAICGRYASYGHAVPLLHPFREAASLPLPQKEAKKRQCEGESQRVASAAAALGF